MLYKNLITFLFLFSIIGVACSENVSNVNSHGHKHAAFIFCRQAIIPAVMGAVATKLGGQAIGFSVFLVTRTYITGSMFGQCLPSAISSPFILIDLPYWFYRNQNAASSRGVN